MRVLLVDDDAAIARSIELMLKIEEINVYRTDLGEEGVDLGKIYDYDIILLDLNLPDMSGYEVLRSLRSAKVVTPVLILSGLASIEDKIRGLGLGADDYLSKPFHKDELIARIHALVRRSKGHAQSVIAVGDLIVNLEGRNVELHGQKLHLTAKEYQILALLALRIGSTLTKEMFLNHLYGGLDDEPEAKIIDVFICKLRKKLANASGGRITSRPFGGAATPCESQPSKRSQANAARSVGVAVTVSRSHTNRHGTKTSHRFVEAPGPRQNSPRRRPSRGRANWHEPPTGDPTRDLTARRWLSVRIPSAPAVVSPVRKSPDIIKP